ncbi:hypothetical protein J6590_086818 [Homalodisca vitripennis]|nr:hypothetical protein J6590_086818 [Homalodisca vitripennis]
MSTSESISEPGYLRQAGSKHTITCCRRNSGAIFIQLMSYTPCLPRTQRRALLVFNK